MSARPNNCPGLASILTIESYIEKKSGVTSKMISGGSKWLKR